MSVQGDAMVHFVKGEKLSDAEMSTLVRTMLVTQLSAVAYVQGVSVWRGVGGAVFVEMDDSGQVFQLEISEVK